jgi:hypothetical protein
VVCGQQKDAVFIGFLSDIRFILYFEFRNPAGDRMVQSFCLDGNLLVQVEVLYIIAVSTSHTAVLILFVTLSPLVSEWCSSLP